MPADPIDRREAKEAIEARAKRYEVAPHGSFEHGVYQGLMMARNSVAALDKLPALDADGRWDRLLGDLAWLQTDIRYADTKNADADHERWETFLSDCLRSFPTAPAAAERRPAVERQLETLRAYVKSLQHNRSMDAFTDGYNLAVEAVLSRIDDLTSGDAAKREGE
jgi:hypothetical protein